MWFEFDPAKSKANRIKHQIDFTEAQKLWIDINRLEIPARTKEGESRMAVIGVIGGRHWTAIVTARGHAIRIISVRRSRNTEKELYENY
jgi:uncharacterized DUF497 family protein